MKRYMKITVFVLMLLGLSNLYSQDVDIDESEILESLTDIDPEIKQYFPRWKVCEQDLMVQIYTAFVQMGYNKADLDMNNIQIMAAPREWGDVPYDILMISCGEPMPENSMNTVEIESTLSDFLLGVLSGEYYYTGELRGEVKPFASRDYCYEDIPVSLPLMDVQKDVVTNFLLRPSDAQQAITLSLFEQTVKIGETGFWLTSQLGNDDIGYHFWSAGEAKVMLQRPLYGNDDDATRRVIPFLINAHLGGAYKITSGIGDGNTLLSWVKGRTLNSDPGGKLIGGIDFHMPFHPQAGVTFNVEVPLKGLETQGIDEGAFGYMMMPEDQIVEFADGDPRALTSRITKVAPMLRTTGRFSLFYNWWIDKQKPENFIRFDFGVNYSEVVEMAYYRDDTLAVSFLSKDGITGLRTYKNSEAADYIFAKIEYSNQAAFPFGISAQISNQIFMGRLYIPLLSPWLYIEGKYATPLRDARPYEIENFFMISPVLRLTI